MSDPNIEGEDQIPAEDAEDDMPLKGVPLPNPPISGPDKPGPTTA